MKALQRLSLFFLCSTLLVCCKPASNENVEQHTDTVNEAKIEATSDTAEIEAMLHKHIAVLASDEFEGRAPATPGEEKTINYLQSEFEALGISPGNGDSYFQSVSVTEITTSSDAVLTLKGSDYTAELEYATDMMVGSQQQVSSTSITDSELVFVGYGIVAPERNWNDYAGIDVTGKTVVILVNDPGYATQNPALFNGNTMTYYGRWTYKYEEAARQGAAGALIVHETGAAGYGWEVVSSSWSGPQIGLQADNLNRDKNDIEGWLTLDSAEALFAAAGFDYQELKAAAAQADFTAVTLGDISASVTIQNSLRTSQTQNVIAVLPGTESPEETIIYTAHWDHLGVNPELPGDNIYNGAADNATGTAALLAMAKLHADTEPAPRSIVFLAVTAEESGLLGSRWYTEHPLFPLETTVANINMDALNTYGPMHDVVVIGNGSSELEDYLAAAVSAQGRQLVAEPNPERGYYYRSDHFNFAKAGVPALFAESGEDSVEFGKEWGAQQAQDYNENRYHAPSDEYDPNWNLQGAAQDIQLYFDVAKKLSHESSFPEWREGNEFKNIRDASQHARQ